MRPDDAANRYHVSGRTSREDDDIAQVQRAVRDVDVFCAVNRDAAGDVESGRPAGDILDRRGVAARAGRVNRRGRKIRDVNVPRRIESDGPSVVELRFSSGDNPRRRLVASCTLGKHLDSVAVPFEGLIYNVDVRSEAILRNRNGCGARADHERAERQREGFRPCRPDSAQ